MNGVCVKLMILVVLLMLTVKNWVRILRGYVLALLRKLELKCS
jgi:hypothetical protein